MIRIKQLSTNVRMLIIAAIVVAGFGLWAAVLRHDQKNTVQQEAKFYKSLTNKDYATARKQAAQLYTDPKTLQVVLAGIALSHNDYQQALKDYQTYEKKFGLTYYVAASMAQVYEKLNDKKNAISYYQKALYLIKSGRILNPDVQIKVYQDNIARLEK